MLHPNQFMGNEAWIAFRLNETPIYTEQDGSFNCNSPMDAASGYILGAEMVPTVQVEPSKLQVRRLLRAAWAEKEQYPATLFLPTGQFQKAMTKEAASLGIVVVPVQEDQLLVFIGEAREGYREHICLVKPNYERSVPRGPCAPRGRRQCAPATLVQAACPAAQRER